MVVALSIFIRHCRSSNFEDAVPLRMQECGRSSGSQKTRTKRILRCLSLSPSFDVVGDKVIAKCVFSVFLPCKSAAAVPLRMDVSVELQYGFLVMPVLKGVMFYYVRLCAVMGRAWPISFGGVIYLRKNICHVLSASARSEPRGNCTALSFSCAELRRVASFSRAVPLLAVRAAAVRNFVDGPQRGSDRPCAGQF